MKTILILGVAIVAQLACIQANACEQMTVQAYYAPECGDANGKVAVKANNWKYAYCAINHSALQPMLPGVYNICGVFHGAGGGNGVVYIQTASQGR